MCNEPYLSSSINRFVKKKCIIYGCIVFDVKFVADQMECLTVCPSIIKSTLDKSKSNYRVSQKKSGPDFLLYIIIKSDKSNFE